MHWDITGRLRSENSESVKQYARIVWASLTSSLEVARYDCLPNRFFPSVSVISAVTAYNVGVFKKTWDTTWIFFLLAILNRLKSFRWYFVMFAINWIYCKVELLQHVNIMKRNNKCYWYVKSFHFTIFWQVFVLHFNPTIFHKL